MSFLTAKALPRRTVLRGLGAAVALPFLDAMLPAASLRARAAAAPPHRFQTFYVPNGMAMEYWTPKGVGNAFELSPILEPLAPFRNQMLVVSGLKANWNYIHAGASGSFLTGTTRGGRNEVEIFADVSMDQILAKHFATETQVASLELAMDPPNNAGACTGNLSCVYTHTLCWRNATQPLPMEYNPRAVFEKLFGDTGSTEAAAREKRLREQKSILDSVTDKLAKLRRELGPGDQDKMNQYTESVRDVERRIEKAEQQTGLELPSLEQPQGVPPVFEDHLALMLDLQLLALQSDLTRVISFMIGKEQSARPYPQIGVPEAHHPLSHHSNVPELIARMSKINHYHAELFAKYVATVEARRAREITNNEPFLDIERQPAAQLAQTMAALKRGEVIVTRGAAYDGSSNEIPIDGGLVNHWRGTVFVPKVKLDALLKVLQEPQTDKHKQEDVLSSRVVSRDGDSQKVYLRLRRTKFVTVVYDTEYDVDYQRLTPDRALSNSISTKVVEIENAGTPRERALPEGNDHGYMWKLNSYWRYKQVDDGVLVEIESLTLSRELPAIIGPLIRPIVTSTARESMTRTLASVRARFAS